MNLQVALDYGHQLLLYHLCFMYDCYTIEKLHMAEKSLNL